MLDPDWLTVVKLFSSKCSGKVVPVRFWPNYCFISLRLIILVILKFLKNPISPKDSKNTKKINMTKYRIKLIYIIHTFLINLILSLMKSMSSFSHARIKHAHNTDEKSRKIHTVLGSKICNFRFSSDSELS